MKSKLGQFSLLLSVGILGCNEMAVPTADTQSVSSIASGDTSDRTSVEANQYSAEGNYPNVRLVPDETWEVVEDPELLMLMRKYGTAHSSTTQKAADADLPADFKNGEQGGRGDGEKPPN